MHVVTEVKRMNGFKSSYQTNSHRHIGDGLLLITALTLVGDEAVVIKYEVRVVVVSCWTVVIIGTTFFRGLIITFLVSAVVVALFFLFASLLVSMPTRGEDGG